VIFGKSTFWAIAFGKKSPLVSNALLPEFTTLPVYAEQGQPVE
jgi:hypothetical protein